MLQVLLNPLSIAASDTQVTVRLGGPQLPIHAAFLNFISYELQ